MAILRDGLHDGAGQTIAPIQMLEDRIRVLRGTLGLTLGQGSGCEEQHKSSAKKPGREKQFSPSARGHRLRRLCLFAPRAM